MEALPDAVLWQHARLALTHGVDALLRRVRAAHEQRAAGSLVVLAGIDRETQRPIEAVGAARLRRLGDELLDLRRRQLLEHVANGLGVRGQGHRLRDAPRVGGVGDSERRPVRGDVESRDGFTVQREDRAIAKIGRGFGGLAQDAVGQRDDRGLARLSPVDPDARRALVAQRHAHGLAVLQRQRHLHRRLVETESAGRGRSSVELEAVPMWMKPASFSSAFNPSPSSTSRSNANQPVSQHAP